MEKEVLKSESRTLDPKQVKGLLYTVTAAVIWVLASFLVQGIEDRGLSPFILSYIANSLFVVFLPLDYLRKRGLQARERSQSSEATSVLHSSSHDSLPEWATARPGAKKLWLGYFEQDLLKAAFVVAPLWFLAQLSFNISLFMTSVTSNTILSNASGLFTYAFSWALLQEKYVAHKLVSILVCATGSSIFAIADGGDKQRPNSIPGDLLCLLSAVFYACYTVAIKKMLGRDEDSNTVLFFGYVGLINLVALAPVMLVLGLTSVISFKSLTVGIFWLVVAKGLFDNALSDYLWARAVLLIGPTTATLGMSLQVPIAIVLDLAFQRVEYANKVAVAFMLLGGWYVLAGFVGITLPPRQRLERLPSAPLEDQ